MPISAVQASRDVFQRYFVDRNHRDNPKTKDTHNGINGFFRAAIDCIFVNTLYHKLPSTDSLKTTVRNYATNMLGSLYTRTHNDRSWETNPAQSPSCGFIAMAFATAYGYVAQETTYRTRALEAAQAINRYYTQNASKLSGDPMVSDDCIHSELTNNIMAIMGAGLADVAVHLYPGNPQNFPYRNALTTLGNYARYSKNSDNNLWRYGGGSEEELEPGLKAKCAMRLAYDVWTVAGLAKIAVGTTYTLPPSTPSSVFWNTARTGVSGLQTLRNLNNDRFPEFTGGGYTDNVSSSSKPAYVLPITWAKEQSLFDMAIGDLDGYDKAAQDEDGGNGNEEGFHRLLWGLTGAMEYNLTVLK